MTTSEQATAVEASHLSEEALGRLRRLLVAEAAAQEAQLAQHRAVARELRDLTDADSALEREIAEAGAARTEEAIADTEHALQRLHASTYGRCEACGARIPFERLEAIPSARLCVACQGRRPAWPW